MKGESAALVKVWNKRSGWFSKVMRKVEESGVQLPCFGKSALYNDVDSSPIARRAASQNCLTGNKGGACPILELCGQAGKESHYTWNVWGGEFKGHPVAPLTPVVVTKWMKETLGQTDSAKILESFAVGIPSLVPLLNEEGGSDVIYMVDECLSLRVPDPRQAVLLRRKIAREALLLHRSTVNTATIDLTCGEYATCISPWHMDWRAAPVDVKIIPHTTKSRCVALAVYLTVENCWEAKNAEGLSGIDRLYIAQLTRVAEAVGVDEPLVLGDVSDSVTWYKGITGRTPEGQEISALLTLMRAGQELQCTTVREILAVGKDEF